MNKLANIEFRFECTGCGKCCTGGPRDYIVASDTEVESMAQLLSMNKEAFCKQYCQPVSDHAWSIMLRPHQGRFVCPLLYEQSCQVYEARPLQCRSYPFWPELVTNESDWYLEKMHCEGIDRGVERQHGDIENILLRMQKYEEDLDLK